MGTEAFWIPAAIAALGTGTTMYTQDQAAKKQDAEAARGIRSQAATQRKADASVNEQIAGLEGSNAEDEQKQSMGQFMDTLRTTRANSQGGTFSGGGERFKEDSKGASADIKNFGEKVAGTLSRINAPGLQRRNEGFSAGRTGSELDGYGRESSGQDFLTRLRMGGIRPNPWGMAAGQVISGVGQGMAAGGYGQKGAVGDVIGNGGFTPAQVGAAGRQIPPTGYMNPGYGGVK